MKKKIKQPKMNYSLKMLSTILEVMEIANKPKYNELIEKVGNILKDPKYNMAIDRGCDIMEYLASNELFCTLACSFMADDMEELPMFKELLVTEKSI